VCFEGFEKLAHKYMHSEADDAQSRAALLKALGDPSVDLVALEKEKIKGAIRTDFILSAEIIAITLGTVQASPLVTQVAVLTGIAVVMTAGVYGLVALIVKLDDAGLYLSQRQGDGAAVRLGRRVGLVVLKTAPYLMKTLSVVGTAAMFLVGGGILTHGIPGAHVWIEHLFSGAAAALQGVLAMGVDGIVGVLAGAIVLAGVSIVTRARRIF
jgi:predicted DNA repair protein MutK